MNISVFGFGGSGPSPVHINHI